MGLFSGNNKIIGTVDIKFYGENEASVEYKTDVSNQEEKESDMLQTFALYYAKMLYNLNKGENADSLIEYITTAVSGVLNADNKITRPNILASGQKLVEADKIKVTKKYSGELHQKAENSRIIQTKMPVGGEGYYAPISTIMFLQWLINNLTDGSVIFLLLVSLGMNEYYTKVGNYSKINSLIDGPNHGFAAANQILNSARG